MLLGTAAASLPSSCLLTLKTETLQAGALGQESNLLNGLPSKCEDRIRTNDGNNTNESRFERRPRRPKTKIDTKKASNERLFEGMRFG